VIQGGFASHVSCVSVLQPKSFGYTLSFVFKAWKDKSFVFFQIGINFFCKMEKKEK